jgi:hypothetical protein
MPDAAPQGGCRATAYCSSLYDLQHTKPVSLGHNSEDHSSYEILSSAIGELSKQNPNNLQDIDKIGKKQLISGGWGDRRDKNMTFGSITEESQKFFQVLAMFDPDTVAHKNDITG